MPDLMLEPDEPIKAAWEKFCTQLLLGVPAGVLPAHILATVRVAFYSGAGATVGVLACDGDLIKNRIDAMLMELIRFGREIPTAKPGRIQ